MSNLLKRSDLLGPGFDSSNFFKPVSDIEFEFRINGFTVIHIRPGYAEFEEAEQFFSLIYTTGYLFLNYTRRESTIVAVEPFTLNIDIN